MMGQYYPEMTIILGGWDMHVKFISKDEHRQSMARLDCKRTRVFVLHVHMYV